MLHIYYGYCQKIYKGAKFYFDYEREKSWILTKRSKSIIKDIDKSIVVAENIIESPIFGTMSPTMLSGGTKTLIVMDNREDDNELVYYGNSMGENCAKWILDIANDKDIKIWFSYYMDFSKLMVNGQFPVDVKVIYNDGDYIKNIKTLREYNYMCDRYCIGKAYYEKRD